jgi:hypothetical protein
MKPSFKLPPAAERTLRRQAQEAKTKALLEFLREHAKWRKNLLEL